MLHDFYSENDSLVTFFTFSVYLPLLVITLRIDYFI